MNDDDDFVERLRSREIARTDQRDAHDKTAKDEERVQQMVRKGAKSAFEEMRSCAESLVQQANAKLAEKFMSFPAPSGFVIKLGNKTAGFTYTTPMFANEDVPHVIVTFQSLASNFAFLQGASEEDELGMETWELEPTWDTGTNSLRWRTGSSTHPSRDIVRGAMEILQGRQP